MADIYDFTGRTMVVTGGAGVLGGEIACSLVARGADVAILDKDPSPADKFKDRLEQGPGRAIVVGGDVLDTSVLAESEGEIRAERRPAAISVSSICRPKPCVSSASSICSGPSCRVRSSAGRWRPESGE